MPQYGIFATCILALAAVTTCYAADTPPNIVFILADDLGWGDVGFHNPTVITPHLDQLAREGVILNQNYVQPTCSPSRSALMTGTYPYRMGLQHLVIYEDQQVCVPLSKKFLPEVLKQRGYATHMVGKWHMGFCDWRCTPTFRGFDSFYGYYCPMEDYYTKEYVGGYDFRDNETVDRSAAGTYSTHLYTERVKRIIENHDASKPLFLYMPYQNVHDPLEVPKKYSDMYSHIQDKKRKLHNGIVTAMDESVGELIANLKRKGIYNNTLIVFSADNGGAVNFGSSNYPLRGAKFTLFEGGTRATSFVHGPMFAQTGVTYEGLMHIVDWFPTLAEAAGATYDAHDQDGISQWQALLSSSTATPRQEVLYNLDLTQDPAQGRAAIRVGDFKLLTGFPGLYRVWYPPPSDTGSQAAHDRTLVQRSYDWIDYHGIDVDGAATTGIFKIPINATADQYNFLFNLRDDPYERHNLYDSRPDIVEQLQARLDVHINRYASPNFPKPVREGEPARWGGVWSPGWCPNIQ